MEINRKNLIENVSVNIDENLIKILVEEYVKMAKSITKNSNVTNMRNLLKQQLNTDSNNKTTSEEFSRVPEMAMNIKEFYQKKGTYRLMDNGQDSILNNQVGWYTFQSWKLQNDKKYSKNEISHRFYINASSKQLPELMQSLIQIYSTMDVPFYFKINCNAQLGTRDAIVLYCSTEQLDNTLSVLSKLEKDIPEIISTISIPHVLTGNINNWVGYASENKLLQGQDSYTGIMCSNCIKAFEKSVIDWIKENPSYTVNHEGKNIPLSEYFNSSLKDDSNKDYTQIMTDNYNYVFRMGHLLAVLPQVDSSFNSRIVTNLKQFVLQNHIDPNNICFNSDVLKELSLLSQNEAYEYQEKDSMQELREMYVEMYNESGFTYDEQERDGTRGNDMDFPVQRPSGIRR